MDSVVSEINRFAGNFSNDSVFFNPMQNPHSVSINDFSDTNHFGKKMSPNTINPKSTSGVGFKSDGFIQTTYTPSAWDDMSERYITTGTPIFCERSIDPHDKGIYPLLPIWRLNGILKESFDMYNEEKEVNKDTMTGDLELITEIIKKPHIEQDLLYYLGRRKEFDELEEDDELREYMRVATKSPVFKHLTMAGIINSYNFIGTGMTQGTSYNQDDITNRSYQNTITNINATTAKKAKIINFFGDQDKVRMGSRLFFVLETMPQGFYQIVPRVVYERPLPRKARESVYWYIGVVKFGATKKMNADYAVLATRSSKNAPAFEAQGKLELIDINLGFK